MGKSRTRNDRSDPWGYFPPTRGEIQRCFECGIETNGRHHVVPKSMGGCKQIPLCRECHQKVHGFEMAHGSSIKDGLRKARERGEILGAPLKVTYDVKVAAQTLKAIGKTYKDIAKSLKISVGSAHKAVKTEL